MKTFLNFSLSIIMLLSFNACSKNDDTPNNPIDQLPPATQTGANTFGCLLDGKAFISDKLPNSYNCFYQNINGEFYFAVGGSTYKDNLIVIALKTEQKQIFEGETYSLYEEYVPGNAFGLYTVNVEENFTSHSYTGELKITKLDFKHNIVSGTFWFDVKDENDVVHYIREGRFDMQFTQ